MSSLAMSDAVLLPEPRAFRQFCRHDNGWSDHYGALQVAAAYAGVDLPGRYEIRGVWQHGSFGPWQHFHPGILVYNAPGARQKPVFVARADEVEVLRRDGYEQVRAIGMPITYTPDPGVERIPGSLLVVPTHSLNGDNHPDRTPFERYAGTIRALVGRFSKVTVCVHPNCRRNGLWLREFTDPRIEIVFGAETSDANALLRMRTLFSRFEAMTTNEWGSHVVYALAFGARVSIAGHSIAGDPALHARDEMWINDLPAMHRAFSAEVLAARREYLLRFYVDPAEGVRDVEFGRWFIGWDQRVSPDGMRGVLGDLVQRLPSEEEFWAHARKQRQEVFERAKQSARAGRRQDAAMMLLGLAQAVVKLKDAHLILETLQEVARELRPIDPARAMLLETQIRRLVAPKAAAG